MNFEENCKRKKTYLGGLLSFVYFIFCLYYIINIVIEFNLLQNKTEINIFEKNLDIQEFEKL
jgi:hypothetical protein